MNYDKLVRLFKETGLSNKKFAAKAGISPSAFGKILKGGGLFVSSLEDIAKALNVPVSYFFDDETGSNKMIGQQLFSIVGNRNKLSRNVLGDSEGLPENEKERIEYENALQIIASQQEEIRKLQDQLITTQQELIEVYKIKS